MSIVEDGPHKTKIIMGGVEVSGAYSYKVWHEAGDPFPHIELRLRADEFTLDYNKKFVPELPEAYKPYYKLNEES